MTTTQKELNNAITHFTKTFRPLVGDDKIVVQMGSKANGRPYRVFVQKDGTGGLWDLPHVGSYLGMTKAEAAARLWAMVTGWEACMESFRKGSAS